jgi:CheY-like chemotaxis protein
MGITLALNAKTPRSRKGTVLVVDDETDIRDLIEGILQDQGYQTYGAGDGFEALERAQAVHPNVITLDLSMPRRGGREFLVDIARDPALSQIPVVVVSAYLGGFVPTPQVIRVVPKPFDVTDLIGGVDAGRRAGA